MHDSKLITLLKSLSNEEFKTLKRFIKSSFYNTNEQVSDLYRYIGKYYPKWNSRMLSKEIVYRQLFPDDIKPNHKRLSNLMSEFSLTVEEFIIQNELKTNSLQKEKIRLSAFANRNLTSSLEKQFEKINQMLENPSVEGLSHFLSKFLVNHKLYFDPSTQVFNSQGNGLKKSMENLELFYQLAKLQISYEMKTRERLLGEQYEIIGLENVLESTSKRLKNSPPILKIYFHLIELHLYEIDDEYFKAKDIFLSNFYNIERTDSLNILLFLLNYSIKKGNNSPLFVKEAFELYKMGLENHILITNKKLSEATFTNIVVHSLKLREFDWAVSFIEEYESCLEPEIREQIKILGLASVFFFKKEYSAVRIKIINHTFPKPIYKIRAKSLLLRAVYEELSDDKTLFDLFIAQSNAFEKFLRRSKKLTEKNKYLKFVQLLRMISRIKMKNNQPIEKSKIKEKALAYGNFANKSWVWEKINDL